MQPRVKIDEWILTDFRNGDIEAYSIIYRQFYSPLFNYGRKFTSCDDVVEDCIQEIFTQFWLNRKKLAQITELKSYLFVSFRHRLVKALKVHRQGTKSISEQDELVFGLELSADQLMIDSEKIYEQRISLNKALEKLTERQKEAIFFKYYENMSYDEIASILSISTKATYKLVARAVHELRSAYQTQVGTVLLSIAGLMLSLLSLISM